MRSLFLRVASSSPSGLGSSGLLEAVEVGDGSGDSALGGRPRPRFFGGVSVAGFSGGRLFGGAALAELVEPPLDFCGDAFGLGPLGRVAVFFRRGSFFIFISPGLRVWQIFAET